MVNVERVERDYEMRNRFSGMCKSWNVGRGLLKREDGGKDVVVHQTQLQMEGHRLHVGELVEFDVQRKSNGTLLAERSTGPFGVDLIGQKERPKRPVHTCKCFYTADTSFKAAVSGEHDSRPPIQQESVFIVRRLTGRCLKWCEGLGFGFIERDDGNADLFVHWSQIKKQGFRTLLPGEPLEFEVVRNDNGRQHAIRVTGPDGEEVIGGEYKENKNRHQKNVQSLCLPFLSRGRIYDRTPVDLYTRGKVESCYKSNHHSWPISSFRSQCGASQIYSNASSNMQFPEIFYAVPYCEGSNALLLQTVSI